MTKKTAHGGRRAGAGRPPVPGNKQTVTAYLPKVIADYLASTGATSATIEAAITGSQEFKNYLRGV